MFRSDVTAKMREEDAVSGLQEVKRAQLVGGRSTPGWGRRSGLLSAKTNTHSYSSPLTDGGRPPTVLIGSSDLCCAMELLCCEMPHITVRLLNALQSLQYRCALSVSAGLVCCLSTLSHRPWGLCVFTAELDTTVQIKTVLVY